MANDLTAVIDKLLARGLMALRENAFMPLTVNREYEVTAGQKGSSIDVPIPSALAVQDVVPGATPPATADSTPTSVPVALDKWKEVPFYLTDKDYLEVASGEDGQPMILPMNASEAVKSLANQVNEDILSLYTKFFGVSGVAGTTPFGSNTSEATGARKVLNEQLAPMDPRYFVMDPTAEANALDLRAFQDASFAGSADAIINGTLNRKLGFQFLMHQLIPSHTKGTGTNIQTGTNNAAGATTVGLEQSSSTGTLVPGDVITFANHTQTYTVTETAAVTLTTTSQDVGISPPLQVAVDGSSTEVAVTLTNSHVVNLAYHRDAFAFATRPLQQSVHPSSIVRTLTDAMSGLTLRLEVTREHKRDRYSYDILYGCEVVRPELGVRVLG